MSFAPALSDAACWRAGCNVLEEGMQHVAGCDAACWMGGWLTLVGGGGSAWQVRPSQFVTQCVTIWKNVFFCHALESYSIASMSFASFSGLVMGA